MTILVTGGAGFIGSHIAEALLGEGHQVVVIDNLSSGSRENIPSKAVFLEGDIGDNLFLDFVFSRYTIDIINHHAAQIDVRKSVTDPVSDARINVLGSLNLLERARANAVKRFVFASTGGAIYGEQQYFPADESHPQQPHSPYGITKRTVELYLEYYRVVHGLEYTAFRYTNVYGPRQDPSGEAGVVAIFTNALLQQRPTVIFGDGKQTRDYVYVKDVVRAHVLLLERGGGSAVYNVATGVETSVNQLHELLSAEITSGHAVPKYEAARKGELDRSVCSSQKLKAALGWAPEVSLEEGLKETVAYFKERQ